MCPDWSCSRVCECSHRHSEFPFECFLSQKLARGVPNDPTCTSPSFVYINFACVVRPIISGADLYLAAPAMTFRVTLVFRPLSTSQLEALGRLYNVYLSCIFHFDINEVYCNYWNVCLKLYVAFLSCSWKCNKRMSEMFTAIYKSKTRDHKKILTSCFH